MAKVNEADRLVDFIARETIELVRKECPEIKNDVQEIRSTAKKWLEMQNLKKKIWKRVKKHLKQPLPPLA